MTFIKHTIRTAFNDLEEKNNKIAKLAESKNLAFGSVVGSGYGKPALGGNTFNVKDILKVNGAKFNGSSKVWVFESVDQLKAALESI
jgi:hypothetical protein